MKTNPLKLFELQRRKKKRKIVPRWAESKNFNQSQNTIPLLFPPGKLANVSLYFFRLFPGTSWLKRKQEERM